MSPASSASGAEYRGWWIGGAIVLAVAVVAAVLWFHYHPF